MHIYESTAYPIATAGGGHSTIRREAASQLFALQRSARVWAVDASSHNCSILFLDMPHGFRRPPEISGLFRTCACENMVDKRISYAVDHRAPTNCCHLTAVWKEIVSIAGALSSSMGVESWDALHRTLHSVAYSNEYRTESITNFMSMIVVCSKVPWDDVHTSLPELSGLFSSFWLIYWSLLEMWHSCAEM